MGEGTQQESELSVGLCWSGRANFSARLYSALLGQAWAGFNMGSG